MLFLPAHHFAVDVHMTTAEHAEAVVALCAAAVKDWNLQASVQTSALPGKAKFVLNILLGIFFPLSLAFLHLSFIGSCQARF